MLGQQPGFSDSDDTVNVGCRGDVDNHPGKVFIRARGTCRIVVCYQLQRPFLKSIFIGISLALIDKNILEDDLFFITMYAQALDYTSE